MGSMIEVKSVKKAYKKRKTKERITAVNHVSFTVNRGEILGLLGPNGAGKTTTIKMICGLLVPDEGTVVINGYDIKKERLKALRHISAVLEGNRNLYWRLTVRENLEYFAGNRGFGRKDIHSKIEELLSLFRLKKKEHELVNNLSRGMQQKLAIAVAMMADTDIILLDEPTLGLDVETGYEVRELLRYITDKEGKTIIISTHDMPVVQDLCKRTVIINEGKVVTDEQVDNLIKLFETRAYSIKLRSPLSDNQLQLLQEKIPMHDYHDHMLEVTLEQDDDIYILMDILRDKHTKIEKMDRTTVDFEQVFMTLLKGEGYNEKVLSSH
ncbi:ABC-2 type transport system ATP-binding protein [Melghiribacillus thermohalophilus]|uniref:ABC-2 type transport system ATP-binding protein n=1 Tax=Melghiribacillus thermohalophilus TaxID=1324956 RepID=A0A4R3MV75_9BACI|nr:ABC transporter ATP-binding protein [Melghiribacillus thermohalophilus]TCT19667.1 ABC-2 type transport system ATP-binding protein [Melghiribacillus thermohalophilus]